MINLTVLYYLSTLGMLDQCLMEKEKDISRDLFPGALEMMILESLRRQPAHGYALVQHIQPRSKNPNGAWTGAARDQHLRKLPV